MLGINVTAAQARRLAENRKVALELFILIIDRKGLPQNEF